MVKGDSVHDISKFGEPSEHIEALPQAGLDEVEHLI